MTEIKICGLKTELHLRAALNAGARYAGFVFFPASPRHIDADQAAGLVRFAAPAMVPVGLFVDPDDAFLQSVLAKAPLGMLQLHGQESPRRIAEIRSRYGLPVMKAIKVAGPEDLSDLAAYEQVADWLLFDAKAPAGAKLPGGNGVVFDWQILKKVRPAKPWMLSGGLTAQNVAASLAVLRPMAVDVSSGVEDAPGFKNTEKIRDFIEIVKTQRSS